MATRTELILDDKGKIYHLKLRPEEIADRIILVGDPGRVPTISKYFDAVELKNTNREIHTHTGVLHGKRITVMSSGMGTDNIDIVMNELDALANIDLSTGMEKEEKRPLDIIRLGTTGAMQADIPVGSPIVSTHGVGLDGTIYFYAGHDSVIDQELTARFREQTKWPEGLQQPYVVRATGELVDLLGTGMMQGMTVTSPGFYGPQGRRLRIPIAYPQLNEAITAFKHENLRITNYEMETAAIFGLGNLMGHRVASVCLVLANRVTGEFTRNYEKKMEHMIKTVLETL